MGRSKRRLTAAEYEAAIARLPRITPDIAEVARRVLVDGVPQKEFATVRTKSAVCQAVGRVWNAAKGLKSRDLPAGYEFVKAVLPEFQAFQVRQWAKQAERALKQAGKL